MATKVTKQQEASFDRAPYIFEKKEVDALGNEIIKTFYSVVGRKQEFQFLYPDGYYLPEIVSITDNRAFFRCSVYLSSDAEKPFRVAHATRDLDVSSEIGKRFVECAETAAIGRALVNAGIGADAFLDEIDCEENFVVGGTPISQKSPGAPAPENPAQTSGKKPEDPKDAPIPKGEAEALTVVITTTESKTLKGKTLAEALSLVQDYDKFAAFLATLEKDGTAAEKVAAKTLRAKLPDIKKAAVQLKDGQES